MTSEKTLSILTYCEEGTIAVTEYTSSKAKMTVKCKNGHIRYITPDKVKSRGDKAKCKECDTYIHSTSKSQEQFILDCAKYNITPLALYKNNHTRITVRNNTCGHEYQINPNSLLTKGSGADCKICNTTTKEVKTQVLEALSKKDLILLEDYSSTYSKVLAQKITCGHEFKVDISSLIYKDCYTDCPICQNNTLKPTEEVLGILDINNLELVGAYLGSKFPITVRNKLCNHEYTIPFPSNLFYNNKGGVCKICYPTSSKEEIEVLSFIQEEYKGWVINNDRKMLEGKELDIVLPDLGIAIEYNGSYWHRETSARDKLYHLGKLEKVLEYEYALVTITDKEWVYKKDIVKSRLRSLLGTIKHKIYARNTLVRGIKFPKEFLNTNHMQGAGSPTKYNLGLFKEDELVAVMTFSKPRFNNNYDYELVRYCSLVNTTVIGGASKLLKAFRINNKGSIISYADRRWSTGNLYKALGFEFSHNSLPNYTYNRHMEVLSRYQCQKHLLKSRFPDLWDSSKTEGQIMSEVGYFKVYDCGSSVWVLK